MFIRSMATRGAGGGLARAAGDGADILDASGRSVVIIETVGVGQSEVEVSGVTDVVVVMLSPESGDGVQAMKSGLLEIADIVVVNKADRPGAEQMEQDLRTAFDLGDRSRKDVPILLAEAVRGKGIPELIKAIDECVAARRDSGAFVERRRRNVRERVRRIAEDMVRADLWDGEDAGRRLEESARQVLEKLQSPYGAARKLLGELKR